VARDVVRILHPGQRAVRQRDGQRHAWPLRLGHVVARVEHLERARDRLGDEFVEPLAGDNLYHTRQHIG
jgi:hypothetical protein